MKMISVFNHLGDEIRIQPDMLEFYARIGWEPATTKTKAKAKSEPKVEESE
jgi:hypothetical protein